MKYDELIVGAIIGFVSSILTTLTIGFLNTFGKVELYVKISSTSSFRKWGFVNQIGNEISLFLPLVIQIQNTSKTTKIVRDLNVYAYNNGRCVGRFTQAPVSKNGKYGNNGSYTFLCNPTSIENYECLFTISNNEVRTSFDELRIQYFDTRNKKKKFKFRDIDNCWIDAPRDFDESWSNLKSYK
ncbi:hypothetical protein [Proteiniclasticum ruminis]|uniref:Uncharacterized protein n=1 Tax=Proteiniclasticum ruminis TaxID=398199 RepID=A0A1I5BAZ5_9CLOT|nr:hypothetical protein [Proteiniclasticum ruminis]SFN71883.1 hypothetical protein SAMN04488695_104109 [Proteiniclasticum ruminis]